MSGAALADPYPVLADLRAEGPLVPSDGVLLATTRESCDAVLRDRRLGRIFAPRQPEAEWETFNWLHADSVLDSEPPKHTRLRRLVAAAFGRGHVARLAPRIQALCDELLEPAGPALGDGTWDVVTSYAEPLPVLVIAELLDWPVADRHLLRPWSQAIVKMYELAPTEEQQQEARKAASEFAEYVAALADSRVGGDGEDLLSDLVRVRDGSDRLSRTELVATVVLLLNAGHEASVNGFGNGLASLLAAPGQQAAARDAVQDPAQAALLVEEMLRHDPPLQYFERTATQDVELLGRTVHEGERVAALLGAAAHDPAAYDDPDTFRSARTGPPHLGFGAGIHFCLGAPLARLELQTSISTLLGRTSHLEVVSQVRRPTFVLRGYESLVLADA
ncbi:cytochrome P450 [Luteipulveratus mongoliensis]|uniref:Cytochrome P450 n=1 Tax=Luteipulveratus mongoliensis TaxID=571913 RepID=A0A0K1JR84_9MICO|nr:cytochrome P450 [Luteipulveratus mongoliensis]